MKKIILILSLLIFSIIAYSQYRILGYYPNTQYGDYVIVYGYYDSTGVFRMSHCRTNVHLNGGIFASNTYLDINTCQIKSVVDPAPVVTPGIPPPPPPPAATQKAFYGL